MGLTKVIMELRKQKEIEYYEKRASDFDVLIGGSEFYDLLSYKFLYKKLEEICPGKIVLDYGCGSGVHTVEIAKMEAKKVVGIDLSEKSLEIARERAKKEKVETKVEFLKMDCEKMEFSDDSFDIVFDGGTFSSIDLKKSWPEIKRVLKPSGILIGIETLGHNPLTNLKRKLNKLTGKRTEWAAEHIFRIEDLREAKKYFNKVEDHYFHLISWLAFPFLRLPGGKTLLKILEFLEKPFLRLPFFKRYAFKIIFTFSNS